MRSLLLVLLLASSLNAQFAVSGQLALVDVTDVVANKADCTKELTAACLKGIATGGRVTLPPGHYYCNIELNNVKGLILEGSGMSTTVLVSRKADTPALAINGCWYSRLSDIGFATQVASTRAVLEINGGSVHGIQGNCFSNLVVNGQGTNDGLYSKYCMTMGARTTGVPPQGSEQLFLNCHFLGASQACYYQFGFNALNNTFIGGNFQAYSKHGIELIAGNCHLFSVGFQSTKVFEQIQNDGWDIVGEYGGANDSIVIQGCRTESLRFAKFLAAQRPSIISCHQNAGIVVWSDGGHEFKAGFPVLRHEPATATTFEAYKLYVCKITNSDTFFDLEKWEPIDFDVVSVQKGSIINCEFQAGNVICHEALGDQCETVTADYALRFKDRSILARADETIHLTLFDPRKVAEGHEVVITRTGKANHKTVKITCPGFFFDDDPTYKTISLNSTFRTVRLMVMGADYNKRWYVVGGVGVKAKG